MKTKIIISALLLFTTLSFSQFNVIVEDSLGNHISIGTLKDSNNYVLIGGNTNNYGYRGISFIKSDTTGSIMWNKFYYKNNENWYEGYSNSFVKKNNIIISCNTIRDFSYDKVLIFVYNEEYDTLFTKKIFNDTINRLGLALTTIGNNYIATGQIDSAGIYSYMTKLDSNFNIIWYKKFTDAGNLLGQKTIGTYDSSLISIGFIYIGNSIYKKDWYIVKTDSLGNLKWWLHPGNPNLNDGSAADIIQTKDSCYVVVGGKAVYRDANGEKFDGHIMKIDRNGNILWDKTYRKRNYNNPDSVYCFFNSVVELNDGKFAVVATEQLDNGYQHEFSKIYILNNNGDTLDSKGYSVYNNYGTGNYPTEYACSLQKTENGGFLISGWGYFEQIFNHPYTQQMFLIKTDQFGCDGTEEICDTLTTANILKAKQQNMVLYPNPAKESITLNLSENNNNKEITIYDIYGRKLKQITTSSQQININVSSLQSGVYILKVGENVAKFIKE